MVASAMIGLAVRSGPTGKRQQELFSSQTSGGVAARQQWEARSHMMMSAWTITAHPAPG